MDTLVEDFVARKPAGLEAAYALWKREFYTVAYHTLHNAASAEDCVHDALVRVWRSANTFSGDRTLLRAYLLMCVRNEALSTLRSEGRRTAREQKALQLAPPLESGVEVADPFEARRVNDALSALPKEQREVLEFAYYKNKTHVQISRESGIPLGTIKSRIAMAMRKLQAELAREESRT